MSGIATLQYAREEEQDIFNTLLDHFLRQNRGAEVAAHTVQFCTFLKSQIIGCSARNFKTQIKFQFKRLCSGDVADLYFRAREREHVIWAVASSNFSDSKSKAYITYQPRYLEKGAGEILQFVVMISKKGRHIKASNQCFDMITCLTALEGGEHAPYTRQLQLETRKSIMLTLIH